ncbi:MAG: PP2C family serine/threonine-protein phosphatase [Legionellales bacterium]|jgi:hypothetical protein
MPKKQLVENGKQAENQQGFSENASSTILRAPRQESLLIKLSTQETIATVTIKGNEEKQQDANIDEMFIFSPALTEMGDEFFEQVLIDTYAALEKELEGSMVGEVVAGVDLNGSGASAVICLERKDHAGLNIVYTSSLGQCAAYQSTSKEIKQLSVKDEQRSFGNKALEKKNRTLHIPFVTREIVQEHDYIILASSGVGTHLKPSEVQEQRKKSVGDTGQAIVQKVLASGGSKNTTVKVAQTKVPENSIQVSAVFDGNGNSGNLISKALAQRVIPVLKATMQARLNDNIKYNAILAKKNHSIPNVKRDLYVDLNNPSYPFHYLLASIVLNDSDFAETLTPENLQDHNTLTAALNNSFRVRSTEHSKYTEFLDKKISIWQVQLPNVGKKYQHIVNAEIKKLKALKEKGAQNIHNNKQSKNNDEAYSEQIDENKKFDIEIKESTKEDDAIFALIYRLDKSIHVKIKPLQSNQVILQSRIDNIEKRLGESDLPEATKKRLQAESRKLPEKKSFLPSKTVLRSVDKKAESQQKSQDKSKSATEKGQKVEDELFRGKTQHVFFNGREVSRDEFIEIKNKNKNLDEALKYYDPAMMAAGRPFVMNALSEAPEASEANIYFSDVDGEISCVGECKGYKYHSYDDKSGSSTEIIIPGFIFTISKFNNTEKGKGFDWIGLDVSNSLLNRLVNSLDPQRVTDADIQKAQAEEEYQKAMGSLKALAISLPINALIRPWINKIYNKISIIKESHPEAADLNLLMKTATAVVDVYQQVKNHEWEDPFKQHYGLLNQLHDKYDTELTKAMIIFFVIVGVLALASGIGAWAGAPLLAFAVDAAAALVGAGAGSTVLSGLLYKDVKNSKEHAETELKTYTSKPATSFYNASKGNKNIKVNENTKINENKLTKDI